MAAYRGTGGPSDRGTRLAGDSQPFPSSGWHLCLGADDVDLIAVLKLGRQWLMAAINAATNAAIADTGVDGVGEINRRGAFRQRDKLAFRREAEDLIVEQLKLGVFEKFLRALAFGKHFDEMPQPAIGIRFRGGYPDTIHRLARVSHVLIEGVRRDTALGNFMHFPGSDLHLNAHVVRADHGRVQRAVIILLGRRNVVLEATRHGAPGAVDDAERKIAFLE